MKQKSFSDLFLKIIEQPKHHNLQTEEKNTIKTSDSEHISESDAIMIIKKGRVVGWTKF